MTSSQATRAARFCSRSRSWIEPATAFHCSVVDLALVSWRALRASAAPIAGARNVEVVATSVPSLRVHARRSRIRGAVSSATSEAAVVQPNRSASASTSPSDQPPIAVRWLAMRSRVTGWRATSNSRVPAGLTSVCWSTTLRCSTSNRANVTGEVCAAAGSAGNVCSSGHPASAACWSSHSASVVLTRQRASTRRTLSSAMNASKRSAKPARVEGIENEPSGSRWVSCGFVNSAAMVDVPPGRVAWSTCSMREGSSASAALMRWTTSVASALAVASPSRIRLLRSSSSHPVIVVSGRPIPESTTERWRRR